MENNKTVISIILRQKLNRELKEESMSRLTLLEEWSDFIKTETLAKLACHSLTALLPYSGVNTGSQV